MTITAKLRVEHAEIVKLSTRLSGLTVPETPAAKESVAARGELAKMLIAHLSAEDLILYPRLLVSTDMEAARTAKLFVDEIGGLASVFKAYVARWTLPAIDADWRGFCQETSAVLAALGDRIERENTRLYPLADRAVPR